MGAEPSPVLAILENLPAPNLAGISAALPGWRILHGRDPAGFIDALADASVIIGWHARAAVCLPPAGRLRWVQAWGAGVNHLPLRDFAAAGVRLTSCSGIHARPVAETAFAMILALARRLNVYLNRQRNATWIYETELPEIHGKTMGILGIGEIGAEVARLARAFDMRVLGYRRSAAPAAGADESFHGQELAAMVSRCDFVVNTLPLTPDSARLVDRGVIAAMKATACYINVGRGGTTDEAALVEALAAGWIAGAGLDVFATEPLPPDHPLWKLDNVIITPHNAGTTEFYNLRATALFLRNLEAWLHDGTLPFNLVDLEAGY